MRNKTTPESEPLLSTEDFSINGEPNQKPAKKSTLTQLYRHDPFNKALKTAADVVLLATTVAIGTTRQAIRKRK